MLARPPIRRPHVARPRSIRDPIAMVPSRCGLDRALKFYGGVLARADPPWARSGLASRRRLTTTISGSTPGRAGALAAAARRDRPLSRCHPVPTPHALARRAAAAIAADIPLDGAQRSWLAKRSLAARPTITAVELYWDRPKEQFPPAGRRSRHGHPLLDLRICASLPTGGVTDCARFPNETRVRETSMKIDRRPSSLISGSTA